MKLKGLTSRKPKDVRDVAVEPEMTPKPKQKTKMVFDEDFPELQNIHTVMSYRSFDSSEDLYREPLRYTLDDNSSFDKYFGSAEGIGISSTDSSGEPVWTHPVDKDDDEDRDWYPETNSFDHYEERIVAAKKEKRQGSAVDNKAGIIVPPSLRGTWSECDQHTLYTSPSEGSSTKENDEAQEEKPHHHDDDGNDDDDDDDDDDDATKEEKKPSSSMSPGSPLNEKQKEQPRSSTQSAPLKSALKKPPPIAIIATSPPSSPKTQPSTKTTVAESKDPIQLDSPKAHSSAKVLAAQSAAATGGNLSPTGTLTKSKAFSSTKLFESPASAANLSTSSTLKKSNASSSSTAKPSKSEAGANKSPTPSSTKSNTEETVPPKETTPSKETESPKEPVKVTTTTSLKEEIVPAQSSSTKPKVEQKKDYSTSSRLGRSRLFALRRKFRSSPRTNSSVRPRKESQEVASTLPLKQEPSAPNLTKGPTSDSRGSTKSMKSAAGLAATTTTTATVPSAAVANSQADGLPSKERELRKTFEKNKTEGSPPGDRTDAASGTPSSPTGSSTPIASKNSDTALHLPTATISPSAWSTAATASKNGDRASNLPPAVPMAVPAIVAAVAGLKNIKGKTRGDDAKDTKTSEVKQMREDVSTKVEVTQKAAKVSSSEEEQMDDDDSKQHVGETSNVKSEAKKQDGHANSKSQATSSSDKKEAHRNMRFWKKRSQLNKKGLQDGGEELGEDYKEVDPVLTPIAEANSTDGIMPKEDPFFGVSTDFTVPTTVDDSLFKSEAAEAFLRQIQCGCLADCIPNNKDGKWDGATSKGAVVFSKLELDDEMDIDQAVAAMRRSKRKEPMPIKSIEIPKDHNLTPTSSVTDSQVPIVLDKLLSESSSHSETLQNSRAKAFLQKLAKKSSKRRTENYYHH